VGGEASLLVNQVEARMTPLDSALAGLDRLGPARASPAAIYPALVLAGTLAPIPGVVSVSTRRLASLLRWREQSVCDALDELQAGGLVRVDLERGLLWVPAAARVRRPFNSREIARWVRHWSALPECELRERIASDMRALLAEKGASFVVAFEARCLKPPLLVHENPKPAVAMPKTKAKPRKEPLGKAPSELEFDELWAHYPKRAGSNPKADALRAYLVRRRDDKVPFETIKAGLVRYQRFCEATQKIGTERVMQAATFFGPSQRFAEEWTLPADLVIASVPEALATHPRFESVFAAYPRHDAKEEAWAVWRRLAPEPDDAMAERMVVSIGHWASTPRWREADGQYIPPLAQWLKTTSWDRSFAAKSGADFETITALLNGAVPAAAGGRVYEGEVVPERPEAVPAAVPRGDLFGLSLPLR